MIRFRLLHPDPRGRWAVAAGDDVVARWRLRWVAIIHAARLNQFPHNRTLHRVFDAREADPTGR